MNFKSRKILIPLHSPLNPVYRGDNRRIKAVCQYLKKAGFSITLVELLSSRAHSKATAAFSFIDRVVSVKHPLLSGKNTELLAVYDDMEAEAGFDEGLDDSGLIPFNFRLKIREELWNGGYDAVFIFSPECLPPVIPTPPEVRLIYFPCDVHHVLYSRMADAGIMCGKNISLVKRQETACFRHCSLIATVSERDAAEIRPFASCPVLCVPYETETISVPDEEKYPSGHKLFFVGSKSEINIYGIKRFLKNIWPLILDEVPDAVIDIAGSVCECLDRGLPGVRLHGNRECLDHFYTEARVIVSPVPVGTGIFIKNLEACARGRALVTTPEGNYGLQFPGEAVRTAHTDKKFAGYVIDYLLNPSRAEQAGKSALRYVRDNFTGDQIYSEFVKKLAELFAGKTEKARPRTRLPEITIPCPYEESPVARRDFAVCRVESYIRFARASGIDKIALYGAGKHTRRLLNKVEWGGKRPSVIFDDSPRSEKLKGISVSTPEAFFMEGGAIDLLIVSSDVYEEQMTVRAAEFLRGKGVLLLTIYGGTDA